MPDVLAFEVELDETGRLCAHAEIGTWSLTTDGASLAELHAMLEDLVQLYNSKEPDQIRAYAMVFKPGLPIAA